MRAVRCDRCNEFSTTWTAVQFYDKTNNRYLMCRQKRGKWVMNRVFIDLCPACFKNMEIAIADNVGQVLFDEVKGNGHN